MTKKKKGTDGRVSFVLFSLCSIFDFFLFVVVGERRKEGFVLLVLAKKKDNQTKEMRRVEEVERN